MRKLYNKTVILCIALQFTAVHCSCNGLHCTVTCAVSSAVGSHCSIGNTMHERQTAPVHCALVCCCTVQCLPTLHWLHHALCTIHTSVHRAMCRLLCTLVTVHCANYRALSSRMMGNLFITPSIPPGQF